MKQLILKQQITRKPVKLLNLPRVQSVTLNESNCFEGTFCKAIWPFLVIGQFYGVMPVIGISRGSVSELHFKWKSIRTIYSLFVLTSLLGYSLYSIWEMFTRAVNFGMIVNVFFYSINGLELLSFFGLAFNWAKLVQNWQMVERLPVFHNFKYKKAFIRNIRFTASITLFMALIEHLLSIGSAFNSGPNMYKDVVNGFVSCLTSNSDCTSSLTAMYSIFINEAATFVWNFLDIFIMMISIGLSTHFKILNIEIKRTIESHSHNFWIDMRTQHTKMCKLVEIVDNKIGHMILLSFLNNLFLICKQLFEGLRSHPTYVYIIYFWFSLIFLILRTFAVSFLAAQIVDESKKPIYILRDVPSRAWNTETKRFFDDVLCKITGLSGMSFFFVTRRLILSVIGTIVTYELVLMQFNRG